MGSRIWISVSIMFVLACSSKPPPSHSLRPSPSSPTRQARPPKLVDTAKAKISEAFLLFHQAADSGYLPAIAYVAKAYEYGIGVENELSGLADGAHLYYSIGAALAAGSGQGEEVLAKALQYEKGRSAKEVESMRGRVESWFQNRPDLKFKNGK